VVYKSLTEQQTPFYKKLCCGCMLSSRIFQRKC